MISILVNNQPFTLFETVSVTRTLDASTGTFNITTSTTPNSEFPVRAGDFIIISIDGIDKIYGFVDQARATGDSGNQTIQVSGRDNTCDLIDSTVPDESKVVAGPISLRTLCERTIEGIGDISISVIDETGQINDFTAEELQAADSGTKAMEFLQTYSRKKQVFLIPSGTGNLILFRPGKNKSSSPLLHQKNNRSNNVKNWEVTKSRQSRYRTYICTSQDNVGFSNNADYSAEGMSRRGQAQDAEIRGSRFLEIIAEESMTEAQCIERAKEEANIRRARAIKYSCTVAGFTQADGTLWDIGQTVDVIDEFADIQGEFIIRSVNYTLSLGAGSETKIVCAPIDAYNVQEAPSETDKRKSLDGSKFSRSVPDNKQRFKRDI